MDVLSSDLYGHDRFYESDDSLPDIAVALGVTRKQPQGKPPQQVAARNGRIDQTQHRRASQENRLPSSHSSPAQNDALTRLRRMGKGSPSTIQPSRHNSKISITSKALGTSQAPIIIDLDSISSTSPVSLKTPARNPINRAKSLNSTPVLSSPAPRVSVRTPLHRANTFPSENIQLANNPVHHELSDDEDLKLAIAASLADFEASQVKQVPVIRPAKEVEILSIFDNLDDLWISNPAPTRNEAPPSQSRPTEASSMSTLRPVESEICSSPLSQPSLIRDDTRRLLDEITRNVLKRKSTPDEIPTQPQKKMTTKQTTADTTEDPKP